MFDISRAGSEDRKLSYNDANCVGCGICSDVCPTSSLRLGPLVPIARGLIEMDLISVNEDSCVFCGLCSVSCPFNALELSIDGESVKELENYPVWDVESAVNEEDCVYCGRCSSVCPNDAIVFERTLPNVSDLVRGEIEIDDEQCIFCSFCADLCPAGAITINKSEGLLDYSIEVDTSKCIFCGVCKKICPENAVKEICTTCMYREDIVVPEITGNIFIAQDSCISCGWCEEICPKDAITIVKPFEGTLELVEVEEEEKVCKGESCHACQDVCPCNAIDIVDNKAVTALEFCNLCGACVNACPQNIRVLSRNSMKLSNINSDSWKDILNSLVGK